MTRTDIFSITDELIGAQKDQPFREDFDATVLRHSDSGKWFALVMPAPRRYFYGEEESGNIDCVTLKCDPVLHTLLENTYKGIYPAWHMNKKLWVSIPLDGVFPDGELKKLLFHSFDLTDRKTGRGKIKN